MTRPEGNWGNEGNSGRVGVQGAVVSGFSSKRVEIMRCSLAKLGLGRPLPLEKRQPPASLCDPEQRRTRTQSTHRNALGYVRIRLSSLPRNREGFRPVQT